MAFIEAIFGKALKQVEDGKLKPAYAERALGNLFWKSRMLTQLGSMTILPIDGSVLRMFVTQASPICSRQ